MDMVTNEIGINPSIVQPGSDEKASSSEEVLITTPDKNLTHLLTTPVSKKIEPLNTISSIEGMWDDIQIVTPCPKEKPSPPLKVSETIFK